MPGDLNVKKSWHPALAKNRAKVLAQEQKALAERRRSAERQAEIAKEQEIQELRAMRGLAPASRLSWMYEPQGALKSTKRELALTPQNLIDSPKNPSQESSLDVPAGLSSGPSQERKVVSERGIAGGRPKSARNDKFKSAADPMAAFLSPKTERINKPVSRAGRPR